MLSGPSQPTPSAGNGTRGDLDVAERIPDGEVTQVVPVREEWPATRHQQTFSVDVVSVERHMTGCDRRGRQPATVETPPADRRRTVTECDEFVAAVDHDELTDATELRVEHSARPVTGTERPHLDHAVEVAAVHGVPGRIDGEPRAGFGVSSFAQVSHERYRTVVEVERHDCFGPRAHQTAVVGGHHDVVGRELRCIERLHHVHRVGVDRTDRAGRRPEVQHPVGAEGDGCASPDIPALGPREALELPDEFPRVDVVHGEGPIETAGDGDEGTVSVDRDVIADRSAC